MTFAANPGHVNSEFLSKYILGMPFYLILEKQEFQGSGVLRFFPDVFLSGWSFLRAQLMRSTFPPSAHGMWKFLFKKVK